MDTIEVYETFLSDEEYDLSVENLSQQMEYSYHCGWNNGLKRAAILLHNEIRLKGTWKLVERNKGYVDIVCPFCDNERFPNYAHGFSIVEVARHLESENLPTFCEKCGAELKKPGNE